MGSDETLGQRAVIPKSLYTLSLLIVSRAMRRPSALSVPGLASSSSLKAAGALDHFASTFGLYPETARNSPQDGIGVFPDPSTWLLRLLPFLFVS